MKRLHMSQMAPHPYSPDKTVTGYFGDKKIIPNRHVGLWPTERGLFLHRKPWGKCLFVKTISARYNWGGRTVYSNEKLLFYPVEIIASLHREITHDGIRVRTIESVEDVPLKFLRDGNYDIILVHIREHKYSFTKIHVQKKETRDRIREALEKEGLVILESKRSQQDVIKIQTFNQEEEILARELAINFFYPLKTLRQNFSKIGGELILKT